jgi:hypothetical protein
MKVGEELLDGQNYSAGASTHMTRGAVGQHQCLSIPSCFSIAVSNNDSAHLPSKQPGTTEECSRRKVILTWLFDLTYP